MNNISLNPGKTDYSQVNCDISRRSDVQEAGQKLPTKEEGRGRLSGLNVAPDRLYWVIYSNKLPTSSRAALLLTSFKVTAGVPFIEAERPSFYILFPAPFETSTAPFSERALRGAINYHVSRISFRGAELRGASASGLSSPFGSSCNVTQRDLDLTWMHVEVLMESLCFSYSSGQAFKHVMTEINDLAGQHEVIAENMQANVIREVSVLVKDFKEERKKLLQEGARMMANLNNQVATLDRALKNYEKAFKEAERALDNFQRADADLNLSRAEVEKQRMNMAIKSQQCEETKNEYANQLQKTNDLQYQHYHSMMPEVFHQLQELDEKRIKNIKNFITQSVDIERNVFPIISKCLDGIVVAADKINEKEVSCISSRDTALVIEKYKSGFQPPVDFPFEDLSTLKSGEGPTRISNTAITSMRPEAMTVKGTMSAGKIKKRVGLFGIFSSNKELDALFSYLDELQQRSATNGPLARSDPTKDLADKQ
uniref:F-BAR domain-containing protein n=1 Tax=Timema douglasi TaxID=61478 RepID=A0A7R8VCZ0_TIMDO|nr:unnamed protein product [Timema douglasi]